MKCAPILFINFNRPSCTLQVFEEIKKVKPKKLYFAVDGPRKNNANDVDAVQKVKNIIESGVDWDCQVHKLYQKENLGCGKGVSEAITWFFRHEPEGIILEDDVVPHSSFFNYSTELLEKYRDDLRIMAITGRNVAGTWSTADSYFFTSTLNVWGWASWRRAWNYYDYDMKTWPEVKKNAALLSCRSSSYRKLVYKTYDKGYTHQADTWDYQWGYAMHKNAGLTIVPKENLVSNVGFGNDATHTKVKNPEIENLLVGKLDFPLKHPQLITEDHHYFTYFSLLSKPSIWRTAKRALSLFFSDRKKFFELLRERL